MVFLLVAHLRLEIKQNFRFGFLKKFIFRRTNGIDMVLMLPLVVNCCLWSITVFFFGSSGLDLISCPRLSRNQKQTKNIFSVGNQPFELVRALLIPVYGVT